jgi:hypothetical protein
VHRALRTIAVGATLLAAVSACDVAVVETPDPEAAQSGKPVAIGAEATGPVTELGSGEAFDLGWRYVIYESAEGWCTELQMVEVNTTGCGPDLLPPEGEHIGAAAAHERLENGVTPVDGIVSSEIVTVWLIDEALGRVPATLMPLDDAGLSGQAFVGFVPADGTPTHIQAVAISGEILETHELP